MRGSAIVLSSCLLASLALSAQVQPRPQAAAEGGAPSQNVPQPQASDTSLLERDFFDLMRSGNAKKFLAYVPKGGVNVGADAQHLSQAEVEDQLLNHRGLYCKLFDSACIQSEIQLDASNMRVCSYRELLTKSQKVRTAATETTRNGVRQAILVAEVKNQNCTGIPLIDFIFNREQGSWKLFSIP